MVFGSSLWSIYSNIKETRMDIILDRALSSFFEKKAPLFGKINNIISLSKKTLFGFLCID